MMTDGEPLDDDDFAELTGAVKNKAAAQSEEGLRLRGYSREKIAEARRAFMAGDGNAYAKLLLETPT